MTSARELIGLFSELNDLKRTRNAGVPHSIAEQLFTTAWAELNGRNEIEQVALKVAARATASARLGAINSEVLWSAGIPASGIELILERGLFSAGQCLDRETISRLKAALMLECELGSVPTFVRLLCTQPRAGATCPGKPRITLFPPESHGDHCLMVAVYSVLLATRYGADSKVCFLAALAHHLHNAWLPDSGFAGEELLAEYLPNVMETFRDRALEELDSDLRDAVVESLAVVSTTQTPEGQAFHAADVIDRVLQMRWFEQAAGFKLKTAIEDMQLVHAGPVQDFHLGVLREAGLW